MFKQYRIHQIVTSIKRNPVYGITIPEDVRVMFGDALFTVEKSGATIILTSGPPMKPTTLEIKQYKFEDCII